MDTQALRQAAGIPWFEATSSMWTQNASDLVAAADYIDLVAGTLERIAENSETWEGVMAEAALMEARSQA